MGEHIYTFNGSAKNKIDNRKRSDLNHFHFVRPVKEFCYVFEEQIEF